MSAVVYRLLASGSTWPKWSPIESFALELEGKEGGESEGAIRLFKTGLVRSREQIVELRPDAALSYVALAGLPIHGHRADIELIARRGGTAIEWRETFEAKVPGSDWLLGRFLTYIIQRCADGLATHATRAASQVTSGPLG